MGYSTPSIGCPRIRAACLALLTSLAACSSADSAGSALVTDGGNSSEPDGADGQSAAADDAQAPSDFGDAGDAGTRDRGRTFEGDALGSCPSGMRCEGDGVGVADVTVDGKTTRAMRVSDTSTTTQAHMFLLQSGIPARSFDFDMVLRGSAPTVLAVHGSGATEVTGTWRFLVSAKSDKSAEVSVYDGAWKVIGTVASAGDPNAWSRVTIEASTTWCAITLAGKRFTTYSKAAVAQDITSLEVASSGVVPTGTDTYIDNLSAENTGFVVAQETGGFSARFPDIVRMKDGRLLAVYQSSTAHTGVAANASSIKMVFSKDNGATWTAPKIAVDSTYDDRDPKVSVRADGTVLLNWFQDHWTAASTYDNEGVFVARMAPGGSSFSASTHVPTPGGVGFEHGPTVPLPSGDVLLPYYDNGARLIRSHDGGVTWDVASNMVVAPNTPTRGYVEPHIVRMPSGELIMAIRTTDVTANSEIGATLTRSRDDGKTWSAFESTDYVNGSMHLLVTSDARILFAYGHTPTAHRPTFAALIDDPETAAWKTTSYPGYLLYDSGYSDQANPSSAELGKGRYLTLGYNVTTEQLLAYVTTDAFY